MRSNNKKLFDEHRYFCCGYHIFFSHTIYLSLRIRILFRCFHTKCAMDVCVCVQESSMLNESERKSRMSDCGYNECHIFIVVSSGLN